MWTDGHPTRSFRPGIKSIWICADTPTAAETAAECHWIAKSGPDYRDERAELFFHNRASNVNHPCDVRRDCGIPQYENETNEQ